MKSNLRFAIIGCGRIAGRHAEQINRIATLTSVCDIIEERARSLAGQFSCDYTTDPEMLLKRKDIDVVSICTPNHLHAPHTIQSLRSGFHVLCEKPMAISVRDCEAMITEAEKTNRRLFIVKQNRFNPPVEAVKRIIDEGRLGKIMDIQLSCFWNRGLKYYEESDWKGRKSMDGGTLFTQFSHFIDLLYWMIGDIEQVQAYTSNFMHGPRVEFEDTGVVIVKFYNGAIGSINFTINSFHRNMEGSLTLFGEKGTVKIGGQYLNTIEYQDIENYSIPDLPDSNPANNYGFYQGSMSNHDKVYENVIEVLSRSGSIATNGLEGLKTVQIIEKIYHSANK
jgi:UDP-N-acetyl-2-amino-2-deoxyglucuronate dehydrogenase